MDIQYCFRKRRTHRILIVEELKITSNDTASPMIVNQRLQWCPFHISIRYQKEGCNTPSFFMQINIKRRI